MFGVMAFVFPITVTRDGALLSWGWLNTCLPMGSGEPFPCLALLARVAFVLPINVSLFQAPSFLTFSLPILSPIPPWRAGFSC